MNREWWSARVSGLIGLVAVVWLVEQVVPVLQMFSDILLLFFLAWLIAFTLDPLVLGLERMHVPRTAGASVIYLVLILSLGLLAIVVSPLVLDQLGRLREGLPQFVVANLPTEGELTQFLNYLGVPAQELSAIYNPETVAQQLQASAGSLLQQAVTMATSAITVVANVLLLLIISFYFLVDGRRMVWNLFRALPSTQRPQIMLFFAQTAASFGGFLRGQVIQAALFGLLVAFVMAILGLDFVAVAAVASAILMLIPVIGTVLAIIPPLAVALTSATSTVVSVLVTLVPVQFVLINVLMPRILSDQIGMHPLLVFLAILMGLRLGGPLGAFFGIPIMGVLYGIATIAYRRWKGEEK